MIESYKQDQLGYHQQQQNRIIDQQQQSQINYNQQLINNKINKQEQQDNTNHNYYSDHINNTQQQYINDNTQHNSFESDQSNKGDSDCLIDQTSDYIHHDHINQYNNNNNSIQQSNNMPFINSYHNNNNNIIQCQSNQQQYQFQQCNQGLNNIQSQGYNILNNDDEGNINNNIIDKLDNEIKCDFYQQDIDIEEQYKEIYNKQIEINNIHSTSNKNNNDNNNNTYLDFYDIKLLSFLVFCVNYGFSIEMVFISPFFLKVQTPDVLDTVIWLIPPFLVKLLMPYLNIPLKNKSINMLKQRKLYILLSCALSILGLFLMGFSRYITANWIALFDDQKSSIMFLGIFGFIFQDVGHDIIMMIVNQYQQDSIRESDEEDCESQFAFASSGGKIAAFLISSVLAFNIELWDVQNFMENLTFSYTVGALLVLFGFLYSFKGLKTKKELNSDQINHNQQLSLKAVYNLQQILPSFTLLKDMKRQQRYLVLSHFLMCGNLLLINIYATLWMGVTLQSSNVKYNVDSLKLRDYLFDLGISWGALILCMAAFLYFFTTRYIVKLKSQKENQMFLFASNFALNLSFIYTYFTENFYSSCLSLLLWGVAQASFDAIPPKLCHSLYVHHKINSIISNDFLEMSLFFCQIFFWFIMPAIFLLFSDFLDDISFSLLQGSVFGLIGSILVLFIR